MIENAEIKAPGAWGDKETSQPGIDSNRGGGARQAGPEVGGKSLSTYRDDREGRNFINQCGQATIGGIVTRLISKISQDIEESENRTAELKKSLEELKELSNQFQQNTQELE